MARAERRYVGSWLQNHLAGRFVSLENPLVPGTPDILYTLNGKTGLIELKFRMQIPIRVPSDLRVSDKQALFAENWTAHGGLYFLVVRFKNPHIWLVVPGSQLLVKGMPRKGFLQDWERVAYYVSQGFPDAKKLTKIFTCT